MTSRADIAAVQPWQRPPFEPGNTAAVTHGAYSVRRVSPLAQRLVDAALSDPALSYLHAPAYLPAVVAWAASEAQLALIADWVSEMTLQQAAESGQGRTSPLELLRKFDSSTATHRARLGLDPLSRAKLRLDQAAAGVDMAKLLAEARRQADDAAAERS
jgi:hypothetical protein